MEQKIFSKFNLYDQIGYLMVGGLSLIIIVFDFTLLNITHPLLDLENSIIWLIMAYAIGHLIQGIANIFIREKKDNFSEEQKVILEKARNYFDVKDEDKNVWNYCYMLATAKDITGQVQQFNTYYSLYRGWTIVLFLQAIFLFTINWILGFSLLTFLLAIFSIICAIIFHKRSKRFWVYLKSKTLQTFVVITKIGI